MAWKLIATKILNGTKQVIHHAQNMIHELSLAKFDNNIKSLVKALKVNRKLLASCRESESSILTNLIFVLKKYPSSEFNSYMRQFLKIYNDGTNIDLDYFMRDIVVKYESLFEDGQLDTKSEKYVKIHTLTSQIQEFKILFLKQSTLKERNKIKNGGNNSVNNGGSSWKNSSPKSGESWKKYKNGRTWHWCR